MHLIVLENEPSSLRGGQEISLFDLCKSLSDQGHSISLLHTQTGNLLEQYRAFCTHIISVQGYRFEPKSIASILNFCTDIHKIPIEPKSLVYSNRYHDSFFAYALACYRNIPFVCHLRLPPPNSLGMQMGMGMRGAQRLIAVSEQTKADWVKAGLRPEVIDVVYNGIDPTHFRPTDSMVTVRQQWQIPPQVRVITYVGRLDKTKGVDILLQALAVLAAQRTDIHLCIAGKPLIQGREYEQGLKQQASHLGIEQYVTFWGHIPDPMSLYQASDLVVLPSVWAEPFGRTLIEAMACGIPVVASRIGGIPEVLVGEFEQGLVPPGQAEALAAKLQQMLDWRDADPTLSQRCRNYVINHFPLTKPVKGVEKVLSNVLQPT